MPGAERVCDPQKHRLKPRRRASMRGCGEPSVSGSVRINGGWGNGHGVSSRGSNTDLRRLHNEMISRLSNDKYWIYLN